jgi:hypothetical protein
MDPYRPPTIVSKRRRPKFFVPLGEIVLLVAICSLPVAIIVPGWHIKRKLSPVNNELPGYLTWLDNERAALAIVTPIIAPLVALLTACTIRRLLPRHMLKFVPWWSRDLRTVLASQKRRYGDNNST